MATRSGSYVGIDVWKERLDVALLGNNQANQAENREARITKLVEQMQALAPDLIVVEATGGYQRALWMAYFDLGRRWQW